MKIINEPIKVMAIFDKGKIQPVKFRLDDEVIKVEKIMKIYEENSFGNNNIIFVCLHNRKDIYELKYIINKNLWYLYKK